MANVCLVGGETPKHEAFISIEEVPVGVGRVRAKLSVLERELRRKWPVHSVDIEARRARRRNPFHPGDVVAGAAVGIVIRYFWAAANSAGKKTGDALGDEIAAHVRRWLRSFSKRTPRKKSRKR